MENFKADKFCVLSLLSVLFSIFQKISIKRCQAPAAPVLTQALNVPYIFYTGYSYILMYMLVFEFEFQNSIMSRLVTCPSTLAPIWIPFKSLIGVQMTVFFGFQLSSLHGFQRRLFYPNKDAKIQAKKDLKSKQRKILKSMIRRLLKSKFFEFLNRNTSCLVTCLCY